MSATISRFAGKAFVGLFLAALVLSMLAGCEREPSAPVVPHPSNTLLFVYTDDETRCQYIGQRTSDAGITPRIAADGKTHMGCGVK